MKNILFGLCIFLVGCSNANWSAISAWGKRHDVRCYSGGIVIFEGFTTGKVENEEHSDGYYFQDEKSGKFVSVSGQCIITVDIK